MTTLDFEVVGDPAPQGSKKHVGGGRMVESSKILKPWRDSVTAAARAAAHDSDWTQPQVVAAVMTFRFHRPRHHFRTGKNAHLLRDNAPRYHHTTPDADKLVRAVGDSLEAAGVIRSDAQIARIEAVKLYVADSDWTGAMVSLYSLDAS